MAVSINKVRIEDELGNVYIPHSSADTASFDPTGTGLEAEDANVQTALKKILTTPVTTSKKTKYMAVSGLFTAGSTSPNPSNPNLLNVGEKAEAIITSTDHNGIGYISRDENGYLAYVVDDMRAYKNQFTSQWQGWQRDNLTISINLTAAGWTGTAAPYMQTVNVSRALASDTGIFDIATSGKDLATAEQLQSEGAKILDITINTGNITARAKEKPTVDLPIFGQIVR